MEQLKELYEKAFLAYVEMLEIHIDTKTTSDNLHRKTDNAYRMLFNIAHSIAERYIDLWWTLRQDHWNCNSQSSRAIEILEELKESLSSISSSEEISWWTKTLIDNWLSELENSIWNLKTTTMKNYSWIELWEKEIEIEVKTDDKKEDESLVDESLEIMSI